MASRGWLSGPATVGGHLCPASEVVWLCGARALSAHHSPGGVRGAGGGALRSAQPPGRLASPRCTRVWRAGDRALGRGASACPDRATRPTEASLHLTRHIPCAAGSEATHGAVPAPPPVSPRTPKASLPIGGDQLRPPLAGTPGL